MRRPINAPYTITNTFGVPDQYAKFGYHAVIDYGLPTGRDVYAPNSGKVVYSQFHSTGGNMVVIYDGKYYHRLMHNSALKVFTNEQVSEGQLVAISGNTGLSTGAHVHWDVNTQGIFPDRFSAFVDPAIVLKGETMDLESAIRLADSLWGWDRTEEHTNILKRDIVGGDFKERVTYMYNHPFRVQYSQYIDGLVAQATNPGATQLKPGLYKVN